MNDDDLAGMPEHNTGGQADSYPLTPYPELNIDDFKDDEALRDLSREEQEVILGALFEIMCAFVDAGMGVDNVHRVFPQLFENAAQDSGNMVVINDNPANDDDRKES